MLVLGKFLIAKSFAKDCKKNKGENRQGEVGPRGRQETHRVQTRELRGERKRQGAVGGGEGGQKVGGWGGGGSIMNWT